MSVAERHTIVYDDVRVPTPWTPVVRRFVGGFYLVMGGINAGIVAADPQTYRTFADESRLSFVTTTWRDVVMAQPGAWLLLLAASEVLLGTMLLRGGHAARAGWAGVLAFHVLLLPFGVWVWAWSLPVLALLVPVALRDWPLLGGDRASPPRVREARSPAATEHPRAENSVHRTPAMVWSTLALSVLVVSASLYGLLAESPYRSLPDATVLGAKAQDACSIIVALVLLVLLARPPVTISVELIRLGLLAYLLYSYLIYVTGVPMNRAFLLYVAIIAIAGAGLAAGLFGIFAAAPPSHASPRLRRGTGWMLVVTAALFAGLWLSTLLPFALGGDRPDPEGVGGTPYPVFFLDLAIVLPCIAAVGVLLLRGRPLGPPLAVVALIKIITLFAALWAGPLVALTTGESVHLGPDAGPSLALLGASTVLAVRWLRSFEPDRLHETGADDEDTRGARIDVRQQP